MATPSGFEPPISTSTNVEPMPSVTGLGPSLSWKHVRGHRDNLGNNRVDQLAVAACQEQRTAEG